MNAQDRHPHSAWPRQTGFSLTELVVTLAVALILGGISVPGFIQAYHSYQLTNAAGQVVDILRLTRYEAIRLNQPVSCIIQAAGPGVTNMWADSNANNVLDPTEKTILLQGGGELIDAGSVPGKAALLSAANLGSTGISNPSSTNGAVQFDGRGAVVPAGNVNVLYLQGNLSSESGFRAVILLPAGTTQIWSADSSGNWHQLR